MGNITIGILAHVDAGKTTLSEGLLYLSGKLRKPGRVDHGDAFLDTYELERARGITIFSKQALLQLGEKQVTLLDTPGHVDFSAEMERTLQVLDYAILVINGADGVQGHTRTLWKLLEEYQIPTFVFVNKMDQEGTDKEALLLQLKEKLSDACVDFSKDQKQEDFWENAAVCEDAMLERYLTEGSLEDGDIRQMIRNRYIFPCMFGSALKVEGVEDFMGCMETYMEPNIYPEEFGAKIYKISRDAQNQRLTHMKITGGRLKVKELLGEEKVNQIRIYSGEKYDAVQEVEAGTICAVTGLTETRAGQGLGIEEASQAPRLDAVLRYRIELPDGVDAHKMLLQLRELQEEDPQLCIEWNEELGEIHAKLMGEVQVEILKSLIQERFGVSVSFGTGNIVYKETIAEPVEGVGHFEPLRHYAEVHVVMEPAEEGSGIVVGTDCSEDVLDRNWQRLILTHLLEKEHRGVLTGSVITDMKITLTAGRAHLKHTEGGDFRQATYRAVRQGLKSAKSILLEPYYGFRLEIPSESTGRAMTDIQKMHGEAGLPMQEGDMTILEGTAPVSEMRDYQLEVTTYTKGRGRLFCSLEGYKPCHNAEEVIEAIGYDSERDLENPTGSVFCSHGAGYNVPWNEVPEHMHLPYTLGKKEEPKQAARPGRAAAVPSVPSIDDKELEEIFIRTYGKVERSGNRFAKQTQTFDSNSKQKKEEIEEEYLLVDGYNIIFAWDDLKELADVNIEAARNRLMDIMCNYQGYKKCTLILVFDAYKVEGEYLEIQKYHNIHVVYTKEAETADQYIEKVVHQIGKKYRVRVATSDRIEQVVTLGQGGTLVSSREFLEEIHLMEQEIREEYLQAGTPGKNYLFNHMDKELASEMEQIRLGKNEDN